MKNKILIPCLAVFILTTAFISCGNTDGLFNSKTLTGLDVLEQNNFKDLEDKSVGLVTNHTARNRQGDHLADLISLAENVELKAIFAPEHGFRGNAEAGEHVDDNIDPATGVPVYSIYGSTRKPNEEMLEDVDALVFDIQDIGARFYTYISTMGNIMEAGAENGIPVYILDRPNPIGRRAEGPVLEDEYRSFVGAYPIPIRHGLTVGELAQMIRHNGWINRADDLDLHIVDCKRWNPKKDFKSTGLEWIDPSPNMRNVNEALLYPGMCLFESTNFSEGRGTEMPFEMVGAPWLDTAAVLEKLAEHDISGLKIESVDFTPRDMPGYSMNPKFEGQLCPGFKFTVTDPLKFKSVPFAVYLISALRDVHPDDFIITRVRWMNLLWGKTSLYDMLENESSPDDIINSYRSELNSFLTKRLEYLRY